MRKLLLLILGAFQALSGISIVSIANKSPKNVYVYTSKKQKITLEPSSEHTIPLDTGHAIVEWRASGRANKIKVWFNSGTYKFVERELAPSRFHKAAAETPKVIQLEGVYTLKNLPAQDPNSYGKQALIQFNNNVDYQTIKPGDELTGSIPLGKPFLLVYTPSSNVHPKAIYLDPGVYYLEHADADGYPTFTEASSYEYFQKNPELIFLQTLYKTFPIHLILPNNKEVTLEHNHNRTHPNHITLKPRKFPYTIRYWSQDAGERTSKSVTFTKGGSYQVINKDGAPVIELK